MSFYRNIRAASYFKKKQEQSKSLVWFICCALFLVIFTACFQTKEKEQVPTIAKTEPVSQLLKPNLKNRTEDGVFSFQDNGVPKINPEILALYENDQIQVSGGDYNVHLTLNKDLQSSAVELLKKYKVAWGSIVAIEPSSGKVLALASHSEKEPYAKPVALRGTFPAASLFKIITSAAALEQSALNPDSVIHYRGGDYTLNYSNYQPDARRDTRLMSFEGALTRSCNPVFARIALQNLSYKTLTSYAYSFGFNNDLPFDCDVERSGFHIGRDNYSVARTAAGFGEVYISPLHAATLIASIGNGGRMMRPYVIDEVSSRSGKSYFKGSEQLIQQTVLPQTAETLLQMMSQTVITGTARRHFVSARNGALRNINIAAKTGTLSGTQPKGLYNWFIATAPIEKPEIAVAALVIDPGNGRINASGLGGMFLEHAAITKVIR